VLTAFQRPFSAVLKLGSHHFENAHAVITVADSPTAAAQAKPTYGIKRRTTEIPRGLSAIQLVAKSEAENESEPVAPD